MVYLLMPAKFKNVVRDLPLPTRHSPCDAPFPIIYLSVLISTAYTYFFWKNRI